MHIDRTSCRSTVVAVAVLLAASMFLGCIRQGETSARNAPTITVVGSTTVLPIVSQAAETYTDLNPKVNIQVSGGGSTVGIKSVGEGTADIGMASRQVKESERSIYPNLVEHVIAKDGIAVIVHPSNPVEDLTIEQIREIYRGMITNWKQVGGPDLKIVTVGRDSASGTREFFHEHVMNNEDFRTDMLEKASNAGVKKTVRGTEGAIGYVGLGYVDSSVKAVKINGVEATVANVRSGQYPISRSLYLYTKGQPIGLVKRFIDFLESGDGQKIVRKEGFVPIA